MEWYSEFITVLILVFALCTLVGGILATYLGSSKSRYTGIGMFVVGLAVGLGYAWAAAVWERGFFADVDLSAILTNAVVYIVAAIVGALIALGIFLLAIMR